MDRANAAFRPALWPTLVTVLACAVLVALGNWQVQRLHWKEGVIAARAARLAAPAEPLPEAAEDWSAWDFRRVQVTGKFRHDLEQQFGVQAIANQVGHHILTPLITPTGTAVLVDRGWVPADRSDPTTRREGQLEGLVTIIGIARDRAADRPGWFTPANQPADRRWYSYDLAALRRSLDLPLRPVVVEADGHANPGGLPIGGQTVTALPNDHLQYAITWYGLAIVLVAIYVGFSLRRPDDVRS